MTYRIIERSRNTGRVLRVIESDFASRRHAEIFLAAYGSNGSATRVVVIEYVSTSHVR